MGRSIRKHIHTVDDALSAFFEMPDDGNLPQAPTEDEAILEVLMARTDKLQEEIDSEIHHQLNYNTRRFFEDK